jgi:hypothetical protein
VRPELRQDVHGVIRRHYSPEVSKMLIKMSKGWQPSSALMEIEEGEENQTETFKKIFDLSGPTISYNRLLKLGAKEGDIRYWMGLKLLTRWSNGQYFFTKKAKLLISRLSSIDTEVAELEKLREKLRANWQEE